MYIRSLSRQKNWWYFFQFRLAKKKLINLIFWRLIFSMLHLIHKVRAKRMQFSVCDSEHPTTKQKPHLFSNTASKHVLVQYGYSKNFLQFPVRRFWLHRSSLMVCPGRSLPEHLWMRPQVSHLGIPVLPLECPSWVSFAPACLASPDCALSLDLNLTLPNSLFMGQCLTGVWTLIFLCCYTANLNIIWISDPQITKELQAVPCTPEGRLSWKENSPWLGVLPLLIITSLVPQRTLIKYFWNDRPG